MARGKETLLDRFPVLAILETVLEIEAFVFLFQDFGISPFLQVFLPLAAHCLAIMLLAFGFVETWKFQNNQDRGLAALGMALTLPMPLLGFLAFVALYMLAEARLRRAHSFLRDYQKYVIGFETGSWKPKTGVLSPGFVETEVDVAPLRDILLSNDVRLKFGAIRCLSRVPVKKAVELLKLALSDENREIRYSAGNALTEMERSYNDTIYNLFKQIDRRPTATELYLDLARVILEYIDSGLLERTMVRYFAGTALRYLDKARLLGVQDPKIAFYAGEMHRRLGDEETALKEFRRYVATAREISADEHLTYVQTCYELGRVDEAREAIRKGRELFPDDTRYSDLAAILGATGGSKEGAPNG